MTVHATSTHRRVVTSTEVEARTTFMLVFVSGDSHRRRIRCSTCLPYASDIAEPESIRMGISIPNRAASAESEVMVATHRCS